ncbi:MAG: hypothetical protein IT306_22050 [Chloroflexi bacterium]|nr:hypothetical protein [Chloroflexota bacterium]
MPNRAEHLAKAQANEALSLSLQSGPALDWSVTILFYAALHLVEAVLAPQAHSRTHIERDGRVRQHPLLRPIYGQYRELKDASLLARYDCRRFTPADVALLRAYEYDVIKQHLRQPLGLTF